MKLFVTLFLIALIPNGKEFIYDSTVVVFPLFQYYTCNFQFPKLSENRIRID